MEDNAINEITKEIIGAAIEVHQIFGGPGLLESIYASALCHELTLRGLELKKQLIVPIKYKNVVIKDPLCLDILVEDRVIVEIKATEKDNDIYQAQLLTYLKLTGKKVGLVINFGKMPLKSGIHRVVNYL